MTKRSVVGTRSAGFWLAGVTMAVACNTSPANLGGNLEQYPEGGVAPKTPTKTDKLDLLLVLDNSISISAQQENLAKAIPDFVQRVLDAHPSLADVHVGLVTTSLGTRGSTLCNPSTPGEQGEAADDRGELIGSRPRFAGVAAQHPGMLPFAPQGFVGWSSGESKTALGESVLAMVEAAGWMGCGFESPLEAAYRFLSDPEPPLSIELEPCSPSITGQCSKRSGIDAALLSQRAAFLRPDSVVAVAMFNDGNDCSLRDEGQGFGIVDDLAMMPRPSAACAVNPNDPCCYPCTGPVPEQCPADPTCVTPRLDFDASGGLNARCDNPKQKYGVNALFPVDRYTNALSKKTLCTSRPNLDPEGCLGGDAGTEGRLVENPLFSGTGTDARDPSMVYLLGVVGVPRADLLAPGGVYRTAEELEAAGTWDAILGTPRPPSNAAPIPPTNALMIESREPRAGNDGQGIPLAPPTAGPFANPQNGHESADTFELQASCLIPITTPLDCAALEMLPDPKLPCDCSWANPELFMSPSCQNPDTGGYERTQRFSTAQPPPRQLELLKSLGDNGVTTSFCSPNFTDTSRTDFGYREAAAALVAQMKRSLK